MSRRQMSDEERQAYREQKRQQAEQALDTLLSQDGWANWLRLRRNLHHYSWSNQVMIASEAHRQAAAADAGCFARDGWQNGAPDTPCAAQPTIVKSAAKWKDDGYHPARGTRSLFVWAPHDRFKKDGTWSCCGQTRTDRKPCPACGKESLYFRLRPVFDASQVRGFETGEPPDLNLPEGEPIEGDDPGDLLVGPLCSWALREDIAASIEPRAESKHGEGGSWNPQTRELRICTTFGGQPQSGNARLRTVIHELAHALGVTSKNEDLDLTYADAECAADCVSYIVASTAGLDTGGESIPYIAGWGGEDARAKVRELAKLIDATAKRLEEPILAVLEPAEADAEPEQVAA